MNAELNLLLKNAKIGNNGERISFLHCSAGSHLKPNLLGLLPAGGHIFVNVFEGFQLLRLGEVLYSPDILAAVSRLSGGPGFEVNVSRLREALGERGNDEAV